MSDSTELKLITNELNRLHRKSETEEGLTPYEVRSFETLVKTKQLLEGKATSISQSLPKEREPSEEEVLAALSAPRTVKDHSDKKKKRSKSDLN